MSLGHIVFLLALLIPLTIDTFILSAALALAGLPKKEQSRVSITLALFEAIMPVVGVLIGRGIGEVLGHFAGYSAAIIIAIAGVLMIIPGKAEDKEAKRAKLLAHTKGLAIIDLGLSISLDELAIGLSLGLLGVPLIVAVLVIGIQAYIASQLGLKLGAKISEKARDEAEIFAGAALIITAMILIGIKITGHQI